MTSGFSAFRFVALSATLALLTAGPVSASLPTSQDADSAPRLGHSGPELRHLGTRTVVAEPKRDVTQIHLANGIAFDTRDGEPELASHLRVGESVAPDETISLLVQMSGPVESDWTEALESAGASGRVRKYSARSAFCCAPKRPRRRGES